jgi:RNA polymerase sigma-70 factor (ECF subfamily)
MHSGSLREVMPQPPTSADLDMESALLACARGDRTALRAIYEREASRLLGVAMRILRRRDLAEDALHEAFVHIWEKARTFDPERGSARGWIYTIVRHQAINMVRERRRDQPLEEGQVNDLPDPNADPFGLTAALSEAEALKGCLEQLDAPKRVCIMLAFVDGYSHAQISARLNMPLGTIKSWIRRALHSLKECLR